MRGGMVCFWMLALVNWKSWVCCRFVRDWDHACYDEVCLEIILKSVTIDFGNKIIYVTTEEGQIKKEKADFLALTIEFCDDIMYLVEIWIRFGSQLSEGDWALFLCKWTV